MTVTNRAFVSLSIKAVSDDARQIEGWATRPEADRVGDVVMPKGAVYKLPLPFLLDHDHRQSVGEVDKVEVTDKGIKFWAHIKKIDEPGDVKDLCDKAWSLVKNGLRKAVSIGFNPIDYEPLPAGGYKFKSWEWLELSAVTVPALASAGITGIKSFAPGETITTVTLPDDAPEIPATTEPAATGKKARVVKLGDPARDRAKPFVIRSIKRT